MLPDAVTYASTGRFEASYRSGACAHGGHFSWDKGMLTPVSDANQCDLRGPTTAQIGVGNDWPWYDDDLLVLYEASYRPDSSPSTRRVFIFDPYSDSLTVRGEFDGALTANTTTELTVQFQNVQDLQRQLLGLQVTAQTVTPAADGNGFVASGQEVTLASRDYTGVVLAPQAAHTDTFPVTPPESAENVLFRFTVDYSDERQPYHGSRDFLTAVP
jgi:hypothetical protein